MMIVMDALREGAWESEDLPATSIITRLLHQ